jgi:hypothetical protein
MGKELSVFPIHTATACQFKWTWSTLFLSVGTSSSCHRCKGWDISEDIQNFHNHPGKLEDRKKMLDGKWPGNGCEYCKSIEDAGGVSERTSYINGSLLAPKELLTNASEIEVTPRILEVYFTNVCNQKCVYCSPFFSSLIQNEIEKYGPIEAEYDLMGFKGKEGYDKRKEEFWKWMDKHSTDLYHFQILGGEPMYQEEFEECLTFFEARQHPNTNWKIFSNLKHDPEQFKKKIDRISTLIENKKLESFEIVCSMDCWGPEAEFSRFGMNLKEWETNFMTLLNSPHVQVSVHSTITPLTLPTAAEFYHKFHEWSKIKTINYGWNIVVTPSFMDPCIIGHYAEKYFDDLLNEVPDDDHRKNYLNGFKQKVVKHQIDPIRLKKLHDYLENIDKRRGTDWKALYPWLYEIYEKYAKDVVLNHMENVELISLKRA